MAADPGSVTLALSLVLGVPTLLLVILWALGRLEAWMLQPEERAAEVQRLLHDAEHAEDVERAVTALVADVTDRRRNRRVSPGLPAGGRSLRSGKGKTPQPAPR